MRHNYLLEIQNVFDPYRVLCAAFMFSIDHKSLSIIEVFCKLNLLTHVDFDCWQEVSAMLDYCTVLRLEFE